MLIWNGAMVPSYQDFFEELGRNLSLTVISPRKWVHGSTTYHLPPDPSNRKTPYKIIGAFFLFPGTAHYLIPLLPWYLFRLRPSHVYLMDELDRFSTLAHLVCTKLFGRPRVYTYTLQNLRRPAYYRPYHRHLLKLNAALVSGVIAATVESKKTLEDHGVTKVRGVVPLGVSDQFFFPGKKKVLRVKYAIPPKSIVVIHAGSLHPSKGVDLLLQTVSANPKILLLLAGSGPLETAAAADTSGQVRCFAPMPGEALREIYQLSDYVVLASKRTPVWMEQIGRSLLEGILCGSVALGSRSGNIPRITRVSETLFEAGDAEALKKLWRSLPLSAYDVVQKEQRNHVLRQYTWSNVAKATCRLMKGVAA